MYRTIYNTVTLVYLLQISAAYSTSMLIIHSYAITMNEHYKNQALDISLSARILHRAPPPRLQVDQNFLTQKIVADPKMRCHQKSFGIWRVTEAILGQKTCFFSKTYFGKNS